MPSLGALEAVAVARLRAAGALIFAKTNMHEIALGATGENAWTGDVKNPYDPARQAGGSSSGAGVAVATGIGVAGLGSDTGGSVRIPAAFSGVVGFKPSFGAIPLAGALHLSWTCDHAGPLTRSVDDAARLFEVMSGRRTDHGAVPRRPRLAVPAKWLAPRMSLAMGEWFESLLAGLRRDADVIDVEASGPKWVCIATIASLVFVDMWMRRLVNRAEKARKNTTAWLSPKYSSVYFVVSVNISQNLRRSKAFLGTALTLMSVLSCLFLWLTWSDVMDSGVLPIPAQVGMSASSISFYAALMSVLKQ
jgi:Asp-tRNA(Asn)/Glu-tRNA(Gln) amidotransferase A subunit family amidase